MSIEQSSKLSALGRLADIFVVNNSSIIEESVEDTIKDWGSPDDLMDSGEHLKVVGRSIEAIRQMRASQLPKLEDEPLVRSDALYDISGVIDDDLEIESDEAISRLSDIADLEVYAEELRARAAIESNTYIRRATRCQSLLASARAKLLKLQSEVDKAVEKDADWLTERKQAQLRYLYTRTDMLEEDLAYWIKLGETTNSEGVVDLSSYSDASVGLADLKQEFRFLLKQIDAPWMDLEKDDGVKFRVENWELNLGKPFTCDYFNFTVDETVTIEVCGPEKILKSGLQKDNSIVAAIRSSVAAYQAKLDAFTGKIEKWAIEKHKAEAAAAVSIGKPPPPPYIGSPDIIIQCIQSPDHADLNREYLYLLDMYDAVMEEIRWEATWGAIIAVDTLYKAKDDWKKYRTLRIRKVAKNSITLATSVARLTVSAGTDVTAWYGASTAVASLWNVYAESTTSMHTLYGELNGNLKKLQTQMSAVYDSRTTWSRMEIPTSNALKNLLAAIGESAGVSSAFIAKHAITAKTLEKRLMLFRFQIVKSERKLLVMEQAIEADLKTLEELAKTSDITEFNEKVEDLAKKIATMKEKCATVQGPIQAYHARAMEFQMMIRHYNLFATTLMSSLVLDPSSGTEAGLALGDFTALASTTSSVYKVIDAAPAMATAWSELSESVATVFSGVASVTDLVSVLT
jgi:uncharacterized coiled-coil protein SlyX